MGYLHAKIADVTDKDFHALIDELYHCVGIRRDDGKLWTLTLLIQSLCVQNIDALTLQHLPTEGICGMKCEKLPAGVIHDICREIAVIKGTHIESFDGKTVLHVLKQIAPKSVRKPARKRQPTRNESRHETMTRIIDQRRANGDL